MWKHPDYGKFQPGEMYVDFFAKMSGLKEGDSVVDLGCGGGRGSVKLLEITGSVERVDITDNSLDKPHPLIPFHHQSIWDTLPKKYKYGYCCDVMEHIPTEYVMLTLKNIADHCDYAFFDICPMHENFGKHIGEELHLTQKPFVWWKDRLGEVFSEIIDGRDFVKQCIFYVKS